ncbi:MAG: M20/M25/M40 family metallo-hydrolase [Gemmatimonadetes bacterium]|nr:M20/M25/M40 family metallo-hydrolase [Gemmatimonadota bacterium]
MTHPPLDPVELTRDLVKIDSPTGEEGRLGEFLAALLERLGLRVIRQPVNPGRFNVFGFREPPLVVLSTHMDVVPPSLPVREDEFTLYGRGACDAKGIAAAQIAAAERLAQQGERRVGLLFVVGEEQTADGARAAAALEPKGRFVVNGEPTENRLALGTKGILRLQLAARGRAAHSAYPEEGQSAIEPMLDALDRIRRLPLPADGVLGDCTLNIGTIHGGVRGNVIPDSCTAEVVIRTVTETGELLTAVQRAAGDSVQVTVTLDSPPMRLRGLPGFETTVVKFGTDLPWLAPWGERFLIGPGSIRVAHTDHEHVAKEALREGQRCYERMVRMLLETSASQSGRINSR